MNQTVSHLGETLNETLEQAGALGRTAGKKLDEARHSTADALSTSASSVREAAGVIDNAAGRAASTLDSTAKYVRHHDSRGMLVDLLRTIWNYPPSLAICAATVGFLLGRAVRRNTASNT